MNQFQKNISVEDDIIDTKLYEKQQQINVFEYPWKFYKYMKKTNRSEYIARVSVLVIDDFSRFNIISFHREVNILSKLNHPSIMKFFGYSLTNFSDKPAPVILMEPSNQTLYDHINTKVDFSKSNLTETEKLITIYGIASGMSYLHSHNILHCDLKPENIFMNDLKYPKINGFQKSIEIPSNHPENEPIIESKIKGTLKYLSPEIISNLEYSKSSDVYAFSLVVFQIVTTAKNLFKSPTNDDLLALKNLGCDAYLKLIEKCMSNDPKKRPTFDEIVTELKTNREFITEQINEDEYRKYIDFVDNSSVSFCQRVQVKKLDDFLTSKEKTFDISESKMCVKRIEFSGEDLDLSMYKIDGLVEKKREYALFKIHLIDKEQMDAKKLEQFYAQVYNKEISSFCRNDIINFHRKLGILSQINHPAILNFVGFSTIDFNHKLKPVIVTEYCKHVLEKSWINLLEDMIESFFDELPKSDDTKKLIIIYGIASAMSYLHSHNIVHRDLKPENIFLDDNFYPKISGFNIAKEINDTNKSKHIKGTPAYLAPEVYMNKEYSKSSDVYSFSLIMYELFTGERPFNNFHNSKEIKKFICEDKRRPTFNQTIEPTYRSLIERCWSTDPKSRPTFDEIVSELKTNPDFITKEINKVQYFKYVEYLEEYPITFDTTKRITKYDGIFPSKILTFRENESLICLNDNYETETNDLSFEYNYFNLDNYSKLDIKKGSFYMIKEIENDQSDETFAAKVLVKEIPDLSQSEIINFSRELNIIPQLNHPSIIKYIGYNQNYSGPLIPVIIEEYAANQSLLQYTESYIQNKAKFKKKKLNDTKKLIIIYGIASAMSYLHSHNIVHRDLKPENIFLDDNFYPKISGFNIAKEINDTNKSKHIKGTPAYLAPEVYMNKEYSKSSDVYSFSLIMYELFTGERPFNNFHNSKEIKKFICEDKRRPTFNQTIEPTYRSLIERCWSTDPKSRPTFDEIVSELQTKLETITDNFFRLKYNKYKNMIENSQISFDPTKRVLEIDYIIRSQMFEFHKNESKLNFRDIYATELNEVLFDHTINIDDYEKQKLIHISDFFKKHRIIHKKSNSAYFSTKLIYKLTKLEEKQKQNFMKWVNVNLSLNHPCILKFIGYSPINFKHKQYPIIINEYASNGSLEKILENDIKNQSKQLINDTNRLIIIYGIASGMSYLHSRQFIHCNLKPSNIILDDYLFPKIKGFQSFKDSTKHPIPDVSQLIDKYEISHLNIYLSPECHIYQAYSTASDVFSFAMIVYQLISNENPFAQVDKELINQICTEKLRPKFNESVSECYRKLIEKCWTDDPRERPTFDEIVYHLKTNRDFINDQINEDEYKSYIKFIDQSQTKSNNLLLDDFIKSENKAFRKVQIDFAKMRNLFQKNFLLNIGSIDLQKFEKIKRIGSGSFGNVYKVREIETAKIYAAKISIYELDQIEEEMITDLSREISIISQLKHPNIIRYIGYSPHNFKRKPKPIIITEFASNSSLDQIIKMERDGFGNYEWNDTKKLITIYGIAAGMSFLHKQNIIHRDLKPANILLDDYLFPKIADFGMSKFLSDEDILESKRKKPKTSGFKGTYLYSAPEVIATEIYSKKGDVYSFGIIVYEIMTNEIPYKGLIPLQLLYETNNGRRPIFKYHLPYSYRKLIENCWDQQPFKRPSFEEIVKLLETNKGFISQNVDENEYLDYISFVKEQEKMLDHHINFIKVSIDMNLSNHEIEQEVDNVNHFFINLNKFERKEIISKGDFTKLCKIEERGTENVYFGQMSMIKVRPFAQEELEKLTNEIKIIKKLDHPSLLKFIGYSLTNFKKQQKPIIITEYVSNGTLENVLELERNQKSIPSFDETKKLIIIYGIASGMSYMHSKNILHCSLKPSNVYLDDYLMPKIGDFGLSFRFKPSENVIYESISGIKASPVHSSPEVMKFNKYSKSSDVYSFALIVYEMMCHRIPFDEISNKSQLFNLVVEKKYRPKITNDVPLSYRNLIEKCWSQDESERPTFDDIVSKLKGDPGFITEQIDKKNYQQYIEIVDGEFIQQSEIPKIQEI